ncbi:Uncharacterised protein [Lacrimispora sphenoides]|uniref:Uncharacterized protein n=1 Tax=Lacrimispora sphenoides JCM 1415 TaxID=1297793 RepID=A0ABY1CBC8_9FIRM|nr:hypothetical protein SAMN02745906_2608 [[Clostridium] sphenoides JCM 1415]SUY51956.1 Uncharacterised protein [Lacrimispora sphenoides]
MDCYAELNSNNKQFREPLVFMRVPGLFLWQVVSEWYPKCQIEDFYMYSIGIPRLKIASPETIAKR